MKSIETKIILNEIVEDITANPGVDTPHFIIRKTPAIFGDKTMIKQIFQNIVNPRDTDVPLKVSYLLYRKIYSTGVAE